MVKFSIRTLLTLMDRMIELIHRCESDEEVYIVEVMMEVLSERLREKQKEIQEQTTLKSSS